MGQAKDFNTAPALPGYYCKNKGHKPSYIPFLSVNDGVCDYELCCDGSDEWAQVGGLHCPDRCKEIGKEWRKKEDERKSSMSKASKKRKELVDQAQRLRKEVEDQVSNLKTEIVAFETKVRDLEAQLQDIERRERGKVGKVAGTVGKVGLLTTLAKDRIEELREFLIDVRSQRDGLQARVKELESILTTFKEEYNPNFNDEGVKRAVRSWEEYAARDKPTGTDDAHERDLDELSKPDSETGLINWEEWKDEGEGDVDLRMYFIIYTLSPNLLTITQSTSLKSIFRNLYVTGSTKN
jgi:protein kinase C substrate 80K-H